MSRREMCGLGASALAMAGLASCTSRESHNDTSTKKSLEKKTLPATEEHVRLIGRTCQKDGVTWLPQSGSGIEFAVTGTKVSVDLEGDDNAGSDEDKFTRYAILLDGKVIKDETIGNSRHTTEVFSEDSTRNAVVEIVHLSEAAYGAIGVANIVVESEDQNPVSPTSPKDLSIEFVGDSITCAYGVESISYDEAFTTAKENFMKSYAYFAAQDLSADYSAVCYSGYGIVSGWSSDGAQNTEWLVPPLYDMVAKNYEQPWDFSLRKYDVVVVNLGTNDYTYTGTNEGRMAEFAQGYADFLTKIHEFNPKSYIVCILGTMGVLELFPYVEMAVEDFKTRTGYSRITCYSTKPLDATTDGCGTMGHPKENIQRRDANTLVGVIRRELGLEV